MLDFLKKVHGSIRSSSFKRKGAQMIEELCSYIDSNYISPGKYLDEVCHLYLSIAACSAEYSRLSCIRASLSKVWSSSVFNKDEFVFFSCLLCDALKYLQESDDQTAIKNIRLVIASHANTETCICFDNSADLLNLVTFYNLFWCELLPKGNFDMNSAVRLTQYVNILIDVLASSGDSIENVFVFASILLRHFPQAFTPAEVSSLLLSTTHRLHYLFTSSRLYDTSSEAVAILTLLSSLHPLIRDVAMKRVVLTDLQLAAADLSAALPTVLTPARQTSSSAALEQCLVWTCLIVARVSQSPVLTPCTLSTFDSLCCHILNITWHFDMWSDTFYYITSSLSTGDAQAVAIQCCELYLKHFAREDDHNKSQDLWSGTGSHPIEGKFVICLILLAVITSVVCF
ncbi:hypothetical protein EON64_00510 [archaeon]|nr:MAG: hypothetical protein EON64_00510 [archaeon]